MLPCCIVHNRKVAMLAWKLKCSLSGAIFCVSGPLPSYVQVPGHACHLFLRGASLRFYYSGERAPPSFLGHAGPCVFFLLLGSPLCFAHRPGQPLQAPPRHLCFFVCSPDFCVCWSAARARRPRPRPITCFIYSGRPAVLLFCWRAPPPVGNADPCVFFAFRQPLMFCSSARAEPLGDGSTHMFSHVLGQPLRRRCDSPLLARRSPSGRQGALWGYHAVPVFLCSGRGLPLFFIFKGLRERDFPYSNRSVRCVSSP